MQVADETVEAVKTTATNPVVVELVDEDIPGATLSEPLEAKNNAALRWCMASVSRYQGSALLE